MRGWVEGTIISTISVVMGLGFLELGSFIYVKTVTGPIDVLEALNPARMAVYRKMFPDLSDSDIKGMFFRFKQVYEPWVQFRNEDLNRPHYHVEGLVRRTVPKSSGETENVLDVFFFGGSTMQGVHVPDDRTLPSEFIKVAAQDHPDTQLRAINYGQPFYYSRQEAILFFRLLQDGNHPAVAVFLDGLNDFLQVGASYQGIPFFTPSIRWLFDQPYTRGFGDVIRNSNIYQVVTRNPVDRKMSEMIPNDIANQNNKLPAHVNREDATRVIAQQYINNLRLVKNTCRANGIICLFFLQPVPYFNYDRSTEEISSKDDRPLFQPGYNFIMQELKGDPNFESLADAFVVPDELPYVDAVHYSPYGHRALAHSVYHKVRMVLQSPR